MKKIQAEFLEIYKLALKAKKRAYAPYSNFKVGAALKTKSGKIYTASNVENSSFGLTVCAERIAIFKAVNDGYKDFKIIAVCADKEVFPCGACLQVMNEFSPELKILLKIEGNLKVFKLKELLPFGFEKDFSL
ncbi:MAG: cytidine deaminase [Candidatus Hydrothermales bacterium]